MSKILNIGILINNFIIRSWEYSAIHRIHDVDHTRISLIINYKDNSEKKNQKTDYPLPFILHKHIDGKIFSGSRNNSSQKDLRELLKDVPVVEINSCENQKSEYQSINDVDQIRQYNLDIIIKLGYGFIKGEILKVPGYGVWSYSINHFQSEDEDMTGYYEVIRNRPVTVSELGVINEDGEKYNVLNRVVESACPYSVSLNRDAIFARAPFLLPAVLEGIQIHGSQYFKHLANRYGREGQLMQGKTMLPSLTGSLLNGLQASFILLNKIIKKILYTDAFSWILLFKIGPSNNFLQNSYGSFSSLKPSGDKFWADPFVICRDEKYYVFVEEFIYRKYRGHISVLELDRKGVLLQVQKIIEKPYHMSYPFVFESGNVFYMIPETGNNRTIDLYKCMEFPGKWTHVRSLMENVKAVDTTLFQYNRKWWLFTVIDRIDLKYDSSPELWLFYADDFISGNWTPHPMNPIVTDVRSARPAGKIFIRDGKIYRPSQDCSGRYGNSFDFNQITALTEIEYSEERILKVSPSWDRRLKGAHTFNFDNDFTVIDAYTYRSRFFEKRS